MNRVVWILGVILIAACNDTSDIATGERAVHAFELIDASESGIDFANNVENQENFNILTYRNYYNGAGVAIGDVNNDGLNDIYFTANMGPNKLYLNKGGFEFEDITEKAGVQGTKYWSTGVSMADVNADGLLDIYVCNSGDIEGENKENELFINNGDMTFTEMAADYGLNNLGYSTHATFFDYDLDGDLDCFVLNNSYKDPDRIALYARLRDRPDELGGDKLYRNNGDNTFSDVTLDAGIFTSQIGFGLGVSVGDINADMWPDIYISNDFWERDYLYINQQDGTFKEDLPARMGYTSVSSMGSDIADIDNDGDLDIFSTDMLPPNNYRLKAATRFTEYHLEDYRFRSNYHYQLLQNCLQVNNGNAKFRETAFMSGVAATDWSWGALIFDFDNDGMKDIFVSNGLYHDITDLDFIDFIADQDSVKKIVQAKGRYDFRDFLPFLPHNERSNYAFVNKGDLQFENEATLLGLDQKSYSNGSAYGDLDNDGDYDLVVNNVNMDAFVYQNQANEETDNHYIKIKLKGSENNKWGVGSHVYVHTPEQSLNAHCMPARGFESSVDPDIILGLGNSTTIDSIRIIWPDHSTQVVSSPGVDTTITLNYADAVASNWQAQAIETERTFTEVADEIFDAVPAHTENLYNDFDHERLMPHMMSRQGPAIVSGDVNGDGKDDMIVLGAADDPDKLLINTGEGFRFSEQPAFIRDAPSESVCGALFDMDGDGDNDLMIGVGGNEYAKGFPSFTARCYNNDGQGNFTIRNSSIPIIVGQIGCITPCDFDKDGDMDLFVGGNSVPGVYGLTPRSFMYRNDGNGLWTDISTEQTGPIGMVTDATWSDIDGDGWEDLIVVGEWLPITVFGNDGANLTLRYKVEGSEGWWTSIESGDLDGDGDEDFVAGNWGTNMKFQPTADRPLRVYVNDFDDNQRPECIIEWYPPEDDKAYPFASKMDITAQMPHLKKQILKYHDYAEKQIGDLFPPEKLQTALVYQATNMQTSIFKVENGALAMKAMSRDAQMSPVFGISIADLDNDGIADIYLGGNFYGLKPEVGRHDSNLGGYFKGVGDGDFQFVTATESGIETKGEVRDAAYVNNTLIIARNNLPVQAFQLN